MPMLLRKGLGLLVSIAACAAAAAMLVITVRDQRQFPRTDDAYLQADVIHLAPDVSGRIVALAVSDNQVVRRGDLLFRIDRVPYLLRVDQAQANVDGLAAKLSVTTDQIAAQTSSADTATRGIAAAQAQLSLATATLARLQPLLPRGYVTAEQVDQASTAKRSAEIALQQARLQAQGARQAISSEKPVEAELAAAKAGLAMAQRDLRLTEMRAPCDGRVVGLDIAAGEYAVIGKPLFSLIDTEHWYAVGNFRETELPAIRPGEAAVVYVMQAPGAPVHGVVDSIGSGVAPDEGETFLGLPHVPRSLNWVRIAQRFPVRILLHDPPPALMRIGGSAAVVMAP